MTTTRRGAIGLLAVLGSLTAVGPLSVDMYLPAFPRIADEFAASASQVQLSLTACMVGLGGGQLLAAMPASPRARRLAPLSGGAFALRGRR